MGTRKTFLTLALVTAVWGAGCSDLPTENDPATPDVEDPDAALVAWEAGSHVPDEAGPYAIGHRVFDLTHTNPEPRPLRLHVWYPAQSAAGPRAIYRSRLHGVQILSGAVDAISFEVEAVAAIADAPASAGGPFPAILVSPGWGNFGFDPADMAEHLVTHGYVVASLAHNGSSADDLIADVVNGITGSAALDCVDGNPGPCMDPVVGGLRNRAVDLAFALDLLSGSGNGPTDFFSRLVDPEAIGMIGHSAGAKMALIMGGGSEALGLAPDSRIDAIMPLGTAPWHLSSSDLRNVELPTLLSIGTDDKTTPPALTEDVLHGISTTPRTMAVLRGGVHRSYATTFCRVFTDMGARVLASPTALVERVLLVNLLLHPSSGSVLDYCAYADFTEPVDLRPLVRAISGVTVTPGSVPAKLPLTESTRVTASQAVAFFKTHLDHEPQYERFLLPQNADEVVQLTRCYDNPAGTFCRTSGDPGYYRR